MLNYLPDLFEAFQFTFDPPRVTGGHQVFDGKVIRLRRVLQCRKEDRAESTLADLVMYVKEILEHGHRLEEQRYLLTAVV